MSANAAAGRIVGADVIVVGAGLAGLVATAELADAGRQRDAGGPGVGSSRWAARPGGASAACSSSIRPSSGGWASRTASSWPGRTGWAPPASTGGGLLAAPLGRGLRELRGGREAGVAARAGAADFPVVGWAERGGYEASGHGNSVPRFHITWGTGPGIVEPFARRVREAADAGLVTCLPAPGGRAAHARRRGHRGARQHPGTERRRSAAARRSRTVVGGIRMRGPARRS